MQRSTDGVMFGDVLEVAGAGTTSEAESYQAFDNEPPNGKIYYRLKLVDVDGALNYSRIEEVN